MPNRRRGQVFLEYAISLVGLVTFVMVTLKVWFWMTAMIPARQGAFQNSRLAAGQVVSAGQPVSYQRPMLQLVGGPDTVGGGPGGAALPPPLPSCGATDILMRVAEGWAAKADEAAKNAEEKRKELEETQGEIAVLVSQWENLIAAERGLRQTINDATTKIASADADAQAAGAQIRPLDQRIADLSGAIQTANNALTDPIDPARLAELLRRERDLANRRAEQLNRLVSPFWDEQVWGRRLIEASVGSGSNSPGIDGIDRRWAQIRLRFNDQENPPSIAEGDALRAELKGLIAMRFLYLEVILQNLERLENTHNDIMAIVRELESIQTEMSDVNSELIDFAGAVAAALDAEIERLNARIEQLEAQIASLPEDSPLLAQLRIDLALTISRRDWLQRAADHLATAMAERGRLGTLRSAELKKFDDAITTRKKEQARRTSARALLAGNLVGQRAVKAKLDPLESKMERLSEELRLLEDDASRFSETAHRKTVEALTACNSTLQEQEGR